MPRRTMGSHILKRVHEEARRVGGKEWGALSCFVIPRGQSFQKYLLPRAIPDIPDSNFL